MYGNGAKIGMASTTREALPIRLGPKQVRIESCGAEVGTTNPAIRELRVVGTPTTTPTARSASASPRIPNPFSL